jgi:hypothetical protein
MNKQFEDMLKESEIKNQERKRAKKRKKIAAKVTSVAEMWLTSSSIYF